MKLAQIHFTKIIKVLAIGLLFFGFSLVVFQSKTNAVAGINRTINFQGKLINNPTKINVTNTSYTVVFTIYDRNSGGTALWSETQTVTTADGIFRVALGSVTPFPADFNFNWDGLYLGIKVNSDSEMTPRVQLAAVPYAFNAEKVAGLTVQDTAGNASTSGTLRIANGKIINLGGQNLTFTTSTDTTLTLPTTGTLATLAGIEEFTNKTIGSTGLIFSGATTDITTVSNQDLTISPNGSGNIVLSGDFDSGITVGADGGIEFPLLVRLGIGSRAAFAVDQLNSGDLITASASGTTKFVVENDGDVKITAGQSIDTYSAGAFNLANTNATSAVLGSNALNSFTVTTNSTGDSEVVLPAQSIGASEIVDDAIDFTKLASAQTLDENTTLSFSTLNYILDLTSTGEFFIRDSGNNFAQFLADGTITLGKSASNTTLNLGIGTGADTISIGSNNTVGDLLVIGNDNASTTLSLTGGDDWSITTAGAASLTSLSGLTSFSGAGLSDCDASTSKLQWNDATGTFSCGTDLGSNLQIQSFTDTTTEVATFTSALNLWDGTYPNITPGSTDSKILISVNIRGTSDDANDHNPVFTIRRNIGTNPSCTDTQVGGEFVGGFLTTAAQDWGASVTFSDAPSSTGNVRYTVCTGTTGLDDANSDVITVVLTEIGSSSSGGGTGNVAVRETDSSPSVASASTIEFGSATDSSDEFIVTDEGSGVARIRIGNQVGLLNEAETVTGGWTFDTANTTFTTSVLANGGLNTTSNTDLVLAANGTGDITLGADFDSAVLIGSASTPAPLSVRGGYGSNAAFILDQLNSGDIFSASASGTTRFTIDNSGNLGVAGSVNLSTGNLAFSSTGGLSLNGGTILDLSDEVDINDDLAVAGNVSLTGTTGLTLTGSGADVTFTNLEQISNDTNGTITLGRNDTGVVTLNARDDDATAALSILSGGAAVLNLDTGGAATINIGTTNSNSIVIGNTTSTTNLTFTKGASGNITLTGFNCSTLTNGGVLTTNSSGEILCQNDDGGTATATYWDSSFGAVYPNITTYDLLIGGTTTASAKFGFINVNNGATPTATISATSGNSLIIDANGNIQTTKANTLTLGGGDSGDIQSGSHFRLSDDAGEGISGAGLSDCDNGGTSKLLWDAGTNKFSCGTDQGGTGGSLTVQEHDLSPSVAAVTTLQFGPDTNSNDEFIVTDEGSGKALVRLGNQVGLLNEAETVTGGWTFNTTQTTFSTLIQANGGIDTSAIDQNLNFSANGTGDFVFNIDSGTNLQLSGGADGTDAFVISAGDVLLSDGDFDLSGGDFNITLDTGDSANLIKLAANAGDVFNLSASSVNSIDGFQIDLTSTLDSGADTYNGLAFSWTESTDADIVNAINIGNTTSINSVSTALYIGSGWDSGVVIASGGVAVNGGNITSTQATLTLDAGGTVQISDNLTVTGTTGITLSGTGADLIFANSEAITNDTNGTITFRRNDAGTVILNAADDDATAALTINSGGAATLTLDTGAAAGISIGAANANAITIGNTNTGTALTFDSGSGGINIGNNANTKSINIGGNNATDGSDTVRISTDASSADTINIGNANADTTVNIIGGNDWSVTGAGAATFASLSGAGLSTCNGTTDKLLWNGGSFSCGSIAGGIQDVVHITDATNTTWVDNDTTELWNGATKPNISPSSATNDLLLMVTIVGSFNPANNTGTVPVARIDREIGSTADCADTNTVGSTFGFDIYDNSNYTNAIRTYTFVDAPATTSNVSYTVCTSADSVLNGTNTENRIEFTIIEVNDTQAADFAEIYPTNDSTLSSGELVTLDPEMKTGVKRTEKVYDSGVIGIVSTQPAITIGGSNRESEHAVPIALSGRVPVKVTTQNGVIKKGDYLTSSSIPGVAMKADRSGSTIGIAMDDYSEDGVGKVMVFVQNSNTNGNIVDLLKDKDINIDAPDFGEKALAVLKSQQASGSGLSGSEVVTDRLMVTLEIVTPKLTVDELSVNKLKVGQIEGLEFITDKLAELEGKVATIGANLAESDSKAEAQNKLMEKLASSLEASTKSSELAQSYSMQGLSSETSSVSGNLRVRGNGIFEGILNVVDTLTANNLILSGLATFFDEVVFKAKVAFEGPVTFASDMGGSAVIKKDDKRVEVVFENEFEQDPIVNVSIAFDEKRDSEGNLIPTDSLEAKYFDEKYSYIVVDKSKKGFTIVLNKDAKEDVSFTWTVLNIKESKTIQSRKLE